MRIILDIKSKLFFLQFCLLVITTYSIKDLSFQYLLVALYLLLFLGSILLSKKYSLETNTGFALCMLLFFFWLYGLIIGLVFVDSKIGVFKNFAGMSLYLVFATIFIVRPSIHSIKKAIKTSAVLYIFVSCIGIYEWSKWESLTNINEQGIVALRLYFSIGTLVFMPIISMAILGLILKEKFNHLYHDNWLLALVGILFIILSGSKGFYLALFFVIFVYIMVLFKSIMLGKVYLRSACIFVLLSFSALIFIFFYQEKIYEFITLVFTTEFDSEHPRRLQSVEILSDISVFGHGLGSSLSSGYARDQLGYGFELTYHNILHKFGIFSLGVIFILILPLVKAVYNLIIHKNMYSSSVALGLCVYLIPAYGNPILFAPMLVLFSTVSFYLVFTDPKVIHHE